MTLYAARRLHRTPSLPEKGNGPSFLKGTVPFCGGFPRPDPDPVKTTACFFPFDLFGSAGCRSGAELLADAFQEMLADNRREQVPTRAAAYAGKVRTRQFAFEALPAYQNWRERARQVVRRVFNKGEFLLWVTGNHLGVLPVYDELAQQPEKTLVVQLDAHLDVYNLSDCTAELSHGNFLLHCAGSLPAIWNIGSRELLLRPDYVGQYYRQVFPAATLARDPEPALRQVRAESRIAERVFIDLDCDVFDPAFFPGVTHPLPFGLNPQQVLRFIDAAWSERVLGVAVSEFDPGRDRSDQSLSTLVWLLEYLLLKRYEPQAE
jgi:agmatinase